MKNRKLTGMIFCFALLIGLGSDSNAEIAYSVNWGTDGNQAWTGSLGMDFVVNSAISVSAIGVFDDSSNGISLNGSLTSMIYDISDINAPTLVSNTSATFSNADQGTLIGGSRFKSLNSPVVLGPGTYSIVSYGYSAADLNGNKGLAGTTDWTTNTGGGLLTFIGIGRYNPLGDTTSFPTLESGGGPANRFAAGTFAFTAVPEPSTLAMFGIAMLGLAYRRKS